MTTKSTALSPESGAIAKFPDAPPEEMTAYHHVLFPGYPGSLSLHFGNRETTVILSEIAAALFVNENREGVRYPDLLISFNANPAAAISRNGYLIPEQGKPPDFVLEVASESTGDVDEDEKRLDYARMRVPEYWRFDPSGGDWHSTHLAGDRLMGDEYQPITIHRTEEGHYWGHSDALNLDLCWEDGELRLYDPVGRRYLPNFQEKDERLHAVESERDAEREARISEQEARIRAEARIRELEAQLRQQQSPGPPETP